MALSDRRLPTKQNVIASLRTDPFFILLYVWIGLLDIKDTYLAALDGLYNSRKSRFI